ncbi:MAG: putative membrane protein [Bacteroidia bacterium]|jgi:uncharacterized membrane protein
MRMGIERNKIYPIDIMNRITKELILMTLFCIPLVVIFIFWDDMPNEIPIHYNLDGTSDRVGSKYGLFIFLLPSYFFFLFVELYIRFTDSPIHENVWFIFRFLVISVIGILTILGVLNAMRFFN